MGNLTRKSDTAARIGASPPPTDSAATGNTTVHARWGAALFHHSGEAVFIVDPEDRIVAVNPAFTAITGYDAADIVGRNPEVLWSRHNDDSNFGQMRQDLAKTGSWEGEVWNRRKDGEVFLDRLSIFSLTDEDDAATASYIAILSGVSRRQREEMRFLHLANFDALTDLPSRQLLEGRLQDAIDAARMANDEVAVICLDLDNLKAINEGLGHEIGDQMLAGAANSLRGRIIDGQTLARFSGDEFVIVVPLAGADSDAAIVARSLLDALDVPQQIAGDDDGLRLTASAGIAVFPRDGETPGALIRNAHTAALHARRQGAQNYLYFAADLNKRAMERMGLESRLRRAVDAGEMQLHYQPVVDLRRGRISGVEALLRWRESEDHLLAPANFVPLAEERGMIEDLGDWVLSTACQQARAWREGGLPDLQIAINLSPRQLAVDDFPERVEDVLAETGLTPDRIEFEITESALIRSIEDVDAKLRRLREMGTRLAVDDFGTGYASLSYLRRFAVDAIKIDASFVADIGGSGDGEKLVAAIVAIGQSLDLEVVAEGVETEEQLRFLRRHWCERVQGFHVSRPLPADELEALVRSGPRY